MGFVSLKEEFLWMSLIKEYSEIIKCSNNNGSIHASLLTIINVEEYRRMVQMRINPLAGLYDTVRIPLNNWSTLYQMFILIYFFYIMFIKYYMMKK